MLGNRIGLPHGGYIATLAQLVKSAGGVLYLDARKADGIQKGVNSPLTNPMIDLANSVAKNLFDLTTVEQGGIDGGNGTIIVDANRVRSQRYAAETGIQITVKVNNVDFRIRNIIAYNGSTYHSTIQTNTILTEVTFTLPVGANGYRISFCREIITSPVTPIEFLQSQTQLELGSTATSYEPYGKNNALLTNFAGTSTDGYSLTLLPNGRTMPLLTFEGLDSLLILSNNPIIDITGTGDFEIAVGIFTPSVLQTGVLYFDGNNGSVLADRKIAVVVNSDGSMTLTLEGTNITIATISSVQTNTYYDIRIKRLTGQLTNVINSVSKYDQANTTNLASKSNKRIGALTTNVGGTTHGTYNKGGVSHFIIAIGSDISKLDAVLNKVTADYR